MPWILPTPLTRAFPERRDPLAPRQQGFTRSRPGGHGTARGRSHPGAKVLVCPGSPPCSAPSARPAPWPTCSRCWTNASARTGSSKAWSAGSSRCPPPRGCIARAGRSRRLARRLDPRRGAMRTRHRSRASALAALEDRAADQDRDEGGDARADDPRRRVRVAVVALIGLARGAGQVERGARGRAVVVVVDPASAGAAVSTTRGAGCWSSPSPSSGLIQASSPASVTWTVGNSAVPAVAGQAHHDRELGLGSRRAPGRPSTTRPRPRPTRSTRPPPGRTPPRRRRAAGPGVRSWRRRPCRGGTRT